VSLRRVVILNPTSRHGTARTLFERLRGSLERELGKFDLRLTEGPGDGTRKVREILTGRSHDQILIAGGDGSINEAVNGYFADGIPVATPVPLGVIHLGTGGDFHRTLRKLNPRYPEALRENRSRRIDCGLTTLEDGRDPRYFLNISSIGLGGEVNRRMKASKFQSGAAAYFWHSLTGLLAYDPVPCRFRIREAPGSWQEFEEPLVNLFVCNGECSGGGMRWAPESNLEDGWLDLTLIPDAGKWRLITASKRIYDGSIARMHGVRQFRATEVVAIPGGPVSQEIDGEIRAASGPVAREYHFRILPAAIPVVL
jgi:diacylglycerol kinase family enzyme